MSRSRLVVRSAGPADAPRVAAVVGAVRGEAPTSSPATVAPPAAAPLVGTGVPPAAAAVAVAPAGAPAGPAPEGPDAGAGVDEELVASALRRPDVVVLLAEAGERPVGVLVLRRGEVLPLAAVAAAHVDQLAVVPSERRRGVGRALLAAAARIADADGLERIVVSAPPGGREAHRLLARLGFTPLVVQRCASVPALRRSLRLQSAVGPAGGLEQEASRRAALERVLSRRRRERGLAGTA
ncbi:GNAT family N-acetyltransferase [uncultured Pseudokineococcus sp.]|uniref:GNAT family N-acetyltransferase n=1 Tax=uncultured Pseudokineococcus sp. TaxID=1642928 RepID=UPI00261A4FE3|nr:GNAT family N-acetyltransferase [uncultured Pseudokineococcus sp.]